jgi:hypothetical protein
LTETFHSKHGDFNPEWFNLERESTFGINGLIDRFLRAALTIDNNNYIPTYSTLNAHLNTNSGGHGFLNASICTAPDFVLNMMLSKQRAIQGFRINNNIQPILPHDSISDFYNTKANPSSLCLQR